MSEKKPAQPQRKPLPEKKPAEQAYSIRESIQCLDKDTEALAERIFELNAKLSELQCDHNLLAMGEIKTAVDTSPLVDRVIVINTKVNYLISVVNTIINRVQI